MSQSKEPDKILRGIDVVIRAASKLARHRVDDLRRNHPQMSDAQRLKKLDKTFTTSVVTMGAATGALAAAPGVGTGLALVAATGDTSWFLSAAAGYVIAAAELRGIRVESYEHERALVLLVVAGAGGSTFFTKTAGRTGPHLGKVVANAVPIETIKGINKILGRHFVTRSAGKRGIIKLGSTAPFGVGFAIGGGGNLFMAKGIIKTAKKMFDAAEEFKAADGDEM